MESIIDANPFNAPFNFSASFFVKPSGTQKIAIRFPETVMRVLCPLAENGTFVDGSFPLTFSFTGVGGTSDEETVLLRL